MFVTLVPTESSSRMPRLVEEVCIFRPQGMVVSPGKRYWVEIDLGKRRRKDKKHQYEAFLVEFCSVQAPEQAVSGPGSGDGK